MALLPEEPSTRALLSPVLLVSGTDAAPRLLVITKGSGPHAGDLLIVPAAVLVLWLCVGAVRC